MARLHHLALTAADVAGSAAFYDAVLPLVGYRPGYGSGDLCTWVSVEGDGPEILLYAAEGADRSLHSHGRPGWQHAAFEVTERTIVDDVQATAARGGWPVLHSAREYPEYAENCSAAGYYAVFLVDPAGLRIEVAHIPRLAS